MDEPHFLQAQSPAADVQTGNTAPDHPGICMFPAVPAGMGHHFRTQRKAQGLHPGRPFGLHGNPGRGNHSPARCHPRVLCPGTAQRPQHGFPERNPCGRECPVQRPARPGFPGLRAGMYGPGQAAGGSHSVFRQSPRGRHVHGRQPQCFLIRADASPEDALARHPPVHHPRRQLRSPAGPGPSGRESPHLRHHRGNGANPLHH